MVRAHDRYRTYVVDALCLAAIVALSAAPYIDRLGFYSDDWALLTGFQAVVARGESVIADATTSFGVRPVQGAYLALLFQLFGFEPLGHHIVNTAVIALCAVFLNLLLLQLGLNRLQAFAATLLFAVLPQLSTVRVWYSAFQIPLSMLLALLSMHAQLFFVRSGRIGWLVAAVVAALLSLGAYEIFGPLLAAFAAALAYLYFRAGGAPASGSPRRKAIALIAIVVALALATLLKAALTDRTGELSVDRYLLGARQLVRTDYDWRIHSSLNIFAAPYVHFWLTLKGWGATAFGISAGKAGTALLTATLIGFVAFFRLHTGNGNPATGIKPQRLLLLGIAVFVLGHATFLLVPSITFTPTGIGNRTLVAAAIGVAIILTALVDLATRAVPPRLQRPAFSAVIAIMAFVGAARLQQIAHYWAEAPALQRRVLAAARHDLRWIPAGSTILLYGVCPYHGPAVVFDSSWDVAAALSLALGKSVTGDAVSTRTRLLPAGVTTSIYKQPTFYPYGPSLYVYNAQLREAVRLTDAATARDYFHRETRKMTGCPPSYLAHGVLI